MPRATAYNSEPQTIGEQLLRELPGRVEDIAAAIGVAKTLVSEWRHGQKKPSRKNREKIAKAFSHIRSTSWDEAPMPATADDSDGEASDVDLLSNLESANRLLKEIRAAAQDSSITPTTRERLASREIAVLKFREDLLRRDQLLESEIVQKHPRWVSIRERLARAVAECCGECSTRIIEALREP